MCVSWMLECSPIWASWTNTTQTSGRPQNLLTVSGHWFASYPVPHEMPLIISPSARLEFAGTAPRKEKKCNNDIGCPVRSVVGHLPPYVALFRATGS